MSWRSTQFLAEVSLLLNEISRGTIETLCRTNKLVREMRRDAGQRLLFPSSWKIKRVQDLAVVTTPANTIDQTGRAPWPSWLAPREILQGIEARWHWFNGAEVQSITIRMLLAELGGVDLHRGDLHLAVQEIAGSLVMDSKGHL